MDTRKKTEGPNISHIRGNANAAVACTSSWYIEDGCKFGFVGFAGRVLVGYNVMHFAWRCGGE